MVTYCVRRCLLSARHLFSTVSVPRLLPPSLLVRHQSTHRDSQPKEAHHLNKRGVVQVTGRDTVDLLQGLVTSDVTELSDLSQGISAQYSMMLNVQGRVLYDLILYNHTKVLDDVCFLVECDASLKDEFIKTVKRYRIRKKVDLSDVSDEYQVWSIPSDVDPTQPLTIAEPGGESETAESGQRSEVPEAVFCVPDPRVPQFGQRVLLKSGNESLVTIGGNQEQYESLRYRWGIPEGPTDLPPGECTPLESNLTIMHGVSFTKGCYIGQELTARTHHTGVIRKRLVPLVFDSPSSAIESDSKISTEKGRNAGKVRGMSGKYGLGLLRLQYQDEPLFVSGKDGQKVSLSSYRPGWWPQEMRK
ncbi:putative transferase CAF17 homolog, mitochondrial [Littorina saxatilis]|uniref:CAF17 C-terminal domain-containing protein n=1 Tax=Littorina saxatilis TaxID=31220 RepID=A0AAN9BP77_9CAEN